MTFLEQIRHDRFNEDEGDVCARRHWNAGSRHVESLILQWANAARLEVALQELAEAEAMDLRIKHELTGSV